MRFVLLIATNGSGADPQAAAQVGNALALFLAVLTVLAVVVVAATLIILSRRLRAQRGQMTKPQQTPQLDPWREAARRIQDTES
ncbi:MAG: hypothetical protein L0Y44_14005 [Phycisphaerales bacterium]|nr:hypothetical protein [Phycisphaerales bacterium]MCI0631758.1 hypothetical protein [Phycisphaerales bacterium]MCI0675780.1 hypothetical protein [Phycisphaerales bacterium]